MGLNWPIVGALAGLLLFGLAYNHVVAWMEREGHTEGYTAFLVCIGVGITVLGWGVMTRRWDDMLLLLGCFVASGVPMVLGSVARYMRARARDRAAERAALQKVLRGRAG
jgi:hypothetical protein